MTTEINNDVQADDDKTFTCAIIKPDAVAAGQIGLIISRIEAHPNLFIDMIKRVGLSEQGAGAFYIVHADTPFYIGLVELMGSGPIMVMALVSEGDAVAEWRELVEGIRADYGTSVNHNAVHGSDSEDTAHAEIAFLFEAELAAANPLAGMLDGMDMEGMEQMMGDPLNPGDLPEGLMDMLRGVNEGDGENVQIAKIGPDGKPEMISLDDFAEIAEAAEAEAELAGRNGKLDA